MHEGQDCCTAWLSDDHIEPSDLVMDLISSYKEISILEDFKGDFKWLV